MMKKGYKRTKGKKEQIFWGLRFIRVIISEQKNKFVSFSLLSFCTLVLTGNSEAYITEEHWKRLKYQFPMLFLISRRG